MADREINASCWSAPGILVRQPEKTHFPGVLRGVCFRPLKHFAQIILLSLLIVAMLPGSVRAVDSPFIVDVWGTADGLPQSSVIAITQTHDGYLWLGTLNGLVRFDGNSFTCFNVNNTPGLPGNKIVFLFEDSRSNLWVGTDNTGICRIRNGVVQKLDADGATGKVTSAIEDQAGVVWLGTADGQCYSCLADRPELRLTNAPAQVALQLFYQSTHLQMPAKNGVVWNLQGGQVVKMQDGQPQIDYGSNPWPAALTPAVFRAAGGVSGAILFDANVTAVCEDPSGSLVVGTKGFGVYWANPAGGWQHISTDEGLSGKYVLSLCFDREGNLWVGTDGGGLDRVKRKIFNTPAGLSGGVAQSVSEDALGGLWSAFNLRGLTYYLTNTIQNYGIGQQSKAWSVLVDRGQTVWAGTSGEGLFRFQSGNFEPMAEAGRIGPQINALFQGHDGILWVGGQNGMGAFDGRDWKFYSAADGLPLNPVRALADDADTNLWIGTDGGGLFRLRAGKIIAASVPVKDISCLLPGRDDALWVGTSEHGLGRLKDGHWISYAAQAGLPSDIGYLVADDQNNLWLGSYEGLIRVSLTNEPSGGTGILATRLFGKSDGLPAQECAAGAQPAAIRAHDGRLWFPTIGGLVSVQPAALRPNTNPPAVLIESVLVDGVALQTNRLIPVVKGTVMLTPGSEKLEIHFTALNFSAPNRIHFRYRLEAHDKSWTDLGDAREVQIRAADLPPGNFIFHVTACNEDGVWNETGATLAITVEPPFWRKPWFIAASALGFIAVLAGTIYLISTAKLKRQLRAHRQKELLEKERARIARDLHDQLGANLTQVALLGELAEADKHLPDEVELHAQQIYTTARDTTRSLDEIVWALNSANDTLESLTNYACKYAQDYFALAGVSYRAELPTQLPPTPILPEVRHNVFLAYKEAVNNVVKHAQATEARVKLQLEPGRFILSVTDNGCGLGDLSLKQLRNGMKNMRKRLADVHGEIEILPGEAGGTVIRFSVPLAPQK